MDVRLVTWDPYRAGNQEALTERARPRLTPEGISQAPIPVYGADGTTVIGKADVSAPYHR